MRLRYHFLSPNVPDFEIAIWGSLPQPCGSDAFVAISKPLMFNIRRFIKQHRFQVYDELCLASLPILVYNGERGSVGTRMSNEVFLVPMLLRGNPYRCSVQRRSSFPRGREWESIISISWDDFHRNHWKRYAMHTLLYFSGNG